jgi:hypothetical protein
MLQLTDVSSSTLLGKQRGQIVINCQPRIIGSRDGGFHASPGFASGFASPDLVELAGGRPDRSCRVRRPTTWGPCRWESTMQSVDEPMGFVKFPPQADRFPAGENPAACVGVKALLFSGFQFLRDLLDLHVEAMQQFPRLCCVGVFTHGGILPSRPVPRAVNWILSATEWSVRHAAPKGGVMRGVVDHPHHELAERIVVNSHRFPICPT